MSSKRKRGGILVSALLLVMIPSLLFGEGRTEVKTQEKITLHILGRNWAEKFLNPWLEEYSAETGIKIEHSAYPLRQYFETVEIKAAAKADDIDVAFVNRPTVPSYASRGIIRSLDKYFSAKDMDYWTTAAKNGAMYNGKLYAPAWRDSSSLLYYNKTLLSKAGVAFPSEKTDQRMTWEQVVEEGKKINALGDDLWGFFPDQVTNYYQLHPLPMSLGGSNGLSSDGKRADVTSDAWIKAFTWYGDLFNKSKISPIGLTYPEADSFFAAGKMGLYLSGDWDIKNLAKKDVDFGVAPHPYFQDGKPVTPSGSWHYSVWNYTKHEEAAAKLVWNLSVPPDGFPEVTFVKGGRFPAHKSVLRKHVIENTEFNKQPFIGFKIVVYEIDNTAATQAQTPAFVEFEDILNRAFSDIRTGADPKATLEGAAVQINKALERYQ